MNQLPAPATVHILHHGTSGLPLIKLVMVGLLFVFILAVIVFSAIAELGHPPVRATRLEHQNEI